MHHNIIRIILFLLISVSTQAQFTSSTKHSFYNGQSFISNIGQYGVKVKGHEQLDNVLYGFEGHGSPILFTKKGLLFIHCKIEALSYKQKEKLEKQGVPEEEIEHKKEITDKTITMQWLGANTNVEVVEENKTTDYHTYGFLPGKAYGYKKVTFKNLYNGIDLVYSISPNEKIGFEYSLQVAAGADISQVKMAYGGDVKSLKLNKKGELLIKSSIEGISQTAPKSFYSGNPSEQIKSNFTLNGNTISFSLPQGYDATRAITIDPFVSNTNNLTGHPQNTNKAKDIDYDYAGNVYVTGGGFTTSGHRLAKYNANGVLQWTFAGFTTAVSPTWIFGVTFGGWTIDKSTGNAYLGQGADDQSQLGFRVIRLNSAGLYDNYITVANTNFQENWRMLWSCANGSPQLLAAGGGVTSNINLAVITPPNATITNAINLTGIPYIASPASGFAQDITDLVIDPVNNELYTIFSTNLNSNQINNRIYKNSSPYGASTIAWSTPSGFLTLIELDNRPYMAGYTSFITENSANLLALNGTYLFYWDGKNLKAFNKATGAGVGTPLVTTNTAKMTGGIYADACNNVYIGFTNGTIKVYNFNGTSFNDAPADISITGYATKSVYDIAYNDADKLLYASGDGFVASFDISATCPNNGIFALNVASNCLTGTATATLNPTPVAGSTISYSLFTGTTLISSNTTGVFTGLLAQTNYKIVATINQTCSGIQVVNNFTLPASPAPTVPNANITYCQGATATALTATGTNLKWYTGPIGGVGTTTAPTPNTATVATTTYYVSQTITGSCESARTAITVQVAALPAAPTVPNANITYCQGATATALTATGTNLKWYTEPIGGVGTTTAPTPNTATVATTTYYVSQTNANNCEGARTAITVQVVALPAAPTVTSTNITYCQGATTTELTATGTNLKWYIEPIGGVGTTIAPTPNTATVATTTYYVSQTNANNCEGARTAITVNITPILTVNAGNTVTINAGSSIQLNATATAGADYTWTSNITPISLSNIKILNPIANPQQTTIYELTVRDITGNCPAVSSTVQVIVQGLQDCINVRDIFSPNGDGINDNWLVYDRNNCLSNAAVTVFNRYGTIVYENKNYNNNWQGTYNNKPLPDGTYYATVTVTLINGNKQTIKTSVTLVR
jgi:gliding motility-associated-like protein